LKLVAQHGLTDGNNQHSQGEDASFAADREGSLGRGYCHCKGIEARRLPRGDRGFAGNRKAGALKGKIHVGPEFFELLSADELERWE